MDFKRGLNKAKKKSKAFSEEIQELAHEKERLELWMSEIQLWIENLNRKQKEKGFYGEFRKWVCNTVFNWESLVGERATVGRIKTTTDPRSCFEIFVNGLQDTIVRARKTVEKIENKMEVLRERQYELDFWILEKEEKWAKIDKTILREQIRQIYTESQKLAAFLLGPGREMEVKFDTSDNAPLGYVSIGGSILKKQKKRNVFLSFRYLEDQEEHLLECYRALIIHEIGHLLLHLKPSDRKYWKTRGAVARKVNINPVFFEIFNILLDEHLERLLRDVKKEWRTWFNRLEFRTRLIDLWEFKKYLTDLMRSRYDMDVDPFTIDLGPFEDADYIKIYKKENQNRVTFLSAEALTMLFEKNRPFVFYYTLRHPIPKDSITESWLKDCLDYVPKNLKNLGLFELHDLAMKIYRRMLGEKSQYITVTVIDGESDEEQWTFDVAGEWIDCPEVIFLPGKGKKTKKVIKGSRGGGSGISTIEQTRRHTIPPPPNPEGEPPPPQTVETKATVTVKKQGGGRSGGKKGRYSGKAGGGAVSGNISPAWADIFNRSAASYDAGNGSGEGRGRGRKGSGRPPKTPEEMLKEKTRSGNLSAREKSRLKNEIKKQQQKPQEKKDDESGMDQKPDEVTLPTPPGKADLSSIEKKVNAPPPQWNPDQVNKKAADHFNEMMKDVVKEMERQRLTPVKISDMTAEKESASDYKNVQDSLEYPVLEGVRELQPDPVLNRFAMLKIKKFIPLLLPYLSVISQDRKLRERLHGGRRILSSGIKKHAIYGETRIFKDQKIEDMEEYSDIHVTLLVDTSASMYKDERLAHAMAVATILGECFKECANIETLFFGYNQNIYLCGDHNQHSVNSLAPLGKTNEAAALEYVMNQAARIPRPVKLVVVLTDGLPTSCSVKSCQQMVSVMEKKHGFRFLYLGLSDEPHPAYHNRVNFKGGPNMQSIPALGKAFMHILQ